MKLIKNLMTFHCLKILVAFALAIPLASNATCGLMDKKVSFSDGTSACVNEHSFLNVKGSMKSIPS